MLLDSLERCLSSSEAHSHHVRDDLDNQCDSLEEEEEHTLICDEDAIDHLFESAMNRALHNDDVLEYISAFFDTKTLSRVSCVNQKARYASSQIRSVVDWLRMSCETGYTFEGGLGFWAAPSVLNGGNDGCVWRIVVGDSFGQPERYGSFKGVLHSLGNDAAITVSQQFQGDSYERLVNFFKGSVARSEIDDESDESPKHRSVTVVHMIRMDFHDIQNSIMNVRWGVGGGETGQDRENVFLLDRYFPGEVIEDEEESAIVRRRFTGRICYTGDIQKMHDWLNTFHYEGEYKSKTVMQSFYDSNNLWQLRGEMSEDDLWWNGFVQFEANQRARVWLCVRKNGAELQASDGFDNHQRKWVYYRAHGDIHTLDELENVLSDKDHGLLNFRVKRATDVAFPFSFFSTGP